MMIGKQNCCLNQCKYEPCKKRNCTSTKMSNKITAFPAKKPLTNAAFWRIIKVKRGHTSRRSAPMLSYQEITVQVSSSGRLFPFMVMMIGKQNCCLNQSNLFQKESASQRANAACYFRASQNFKRKREDNRQPVCPLFYIVHISCPLSVRGFFVRYCL